MYNAAYCSVLGLLMFGLSLMIMGEDVSKPKSKRYNDKSFPKHSLVLERNVTCEDIPDEKVGRFMSHTWTCHNIRVDGYRLAYGYYPGIGIDIKCNDTGGKHEFAQLCRELLRKVATDRPLHALYITEVSCDYNSDMRVLLNRTSEEEYTWEELQPGNGWVGTIQCMVVLPGKS
ncbi:uncharacterized protein [Haliotis cracherodii]|uniref:uncharacterized protein n=1 Tax=Haliotis cracherodii TaxID=6455 RepID=UPI0039EAAA0B